MSLVISLLIATAPAVAASGPTLPAAFNNPVPPGKVTTANPRSIVALLQEKGYRAELKVDEGKPYIESGANGAKFSVYLQNCTEKRDCQDVMFYSSYTKKNDKPVTLDDINKFNAKYRWGRAYLDENLEPVIEYDVLFTDQVIDVKMFGEAIEVWNTILADFHKAINY